MRIVCFGNGKYGVRRWNLGYEYLDLRDADYWWSKPGCILTHCHGSIENAEKAYFIFKYRKGKSVKRIVRKIK